MKKLRILAAILLMFTAAGCSHKITGPGPIDITAMRQVEEHCAWYIFGLGPFGDATLLQKPDTIQYSVHNYLIYSSFCTAGYNK
jgi:hypothetical protein